MQARERTTLDVQPQAVITMDENGLIVSVDADDRAPCDVECAPTTVVLPGLIDTHVHAPQWPQLGTGLDLPLEEWLFEHTFPLEARLTEPAMAERVWPAMVSTLLANGTTTAAYYATIDVETTTMLAAVCAELGQRAFVGRVAMDHPDASPDYYRDASPGQAIDRSAASIDAIRMIGAPLVHPVVTPRFAPSCTDDTLRGLGALAASTGALVQTHCSESDWQHGYAFERFGMADTQALHTFGLVRDHTVLAHGGHLRAADFETIRAQGAGIAHCPVSNMYFGQSVFPARRALDMGVRCGLGTDIAGGSQPSLLRQCADAVNVSRLREDGVDASVVRAERGVGGSRISIVEAFHMATVGGADLLGVNAGAIEPGRSFDAIAVDTTRPGSTLQIWPEVDDHARTFEKVVRLASADDITDVWVNGKRIAGVSGTDRGC